MKCAILVVSDTRTLETDQGGELIALHLRNAKHEVAILDLVKDDPTFETRDVSLRTPMRSQPQLVVPVMVDGVPKRADVRVLALENSWCRIDQSNGAPHSGKNTGKFATDHAPTNHHQ